MDSLQGNDKKLVHDSTTNVDAEDIAIGSQEQVDDNLSYVRSFRWSTFYRSVLFQMILFGALSFVGPAMSDAISNLGGGGLSKPWLANLSNSLNYASSCIVAIFGGPLINKLGIKWACMIAAVAMPLSGSSYYANAKFDNQWYLLLANIIGGITGGFLYVGETTAMLSYPNPQDRGFYLGIWAAMRNSGSVVGGAISFVTNYKRSTAGGVSWGTYIIFMIFQCTGIFWAFLLSPTKLVRRRNGNSIPMTEPVPWKQEFADLWKTLHLRKTWFVFIPAFYSFFYGGTMGTYLSLHFSVRARALSSLIVPSIVIPLVIAFGKLLDCKLWTQRTRAWVGFLMFIIPQIAGFIWVGIEYHKLGLKAELDYVLEPAAWARAYLPYLMIFVSGYWTQLTLYWILGTFSPNVKESARTGGLFRAFETLGQAVSYGLSSSSGIDSRIPFYVNCGVLVAVIPCMVCLIRIVPEAPLAVSVDSDGFMIDATVKEKRDV